MGTTKNIYLAVTALAVCLPSLPVCLATQTLHCAANGTLAGLQHLKLCLRLFQPCCKLQDVPLHHVDCLLQAPELAASWTA